MTLCVLIVDDHFPDVVYARRILERTVPDADVHDARSGRAAIEWLAARAHSEQAGEPTLVLMDVNMPGLDGFQTLDLYEREVVPAWVENSGRPARVAFLSSSAEVGERERAARSGLVCDYLEKPLDPARVRELARLD